MDKLESPENSIGKREISLPNGETLEVEVTQAFLDIIREKFSIEVPDPVTDEHVRMFIYGAMDNAVTKAENSIFNTTE